MKYKRFSKMFHVKHFLYFILKNVWKGSAFMKNSKSLLKTTVAAIGVLHCINKLIDSNSNTNTTTKSTGKYYKWKHGDIFYKVEGHGEPLLLIHDLTTFSSNYEWAQVSHQLSHEYTVYSIDLIGCGKSSKPGITYTNFFYVQMIRDFVKNVINAPTKVAATGLSGSFVLMANLMDSDLFKNIMLISPKSIEYLKETPDDHSKILMKLFELPVIGKTSYYIATSKTNTEYFLNKKLFHNHSNVKPGIKKAHYDASHTSNGNGKYLLASLEGKFLNADITNALRKVKKPVIVINGIHDETRQIISSSYKKINQNLVFEMISHSKSLPQLENPCELTEVMLLY